VRPAVVVVLETEIWPNFYREVKRSGASLLVVNARISDRALPRYRRWRWFFRHVLRWPDAILAQSAEDKVRFEIAGAAPDRVRAAGNLKYDFTPPREMVPELADFFARVNPREVWVAASTMADDVDEDDAVIAALPARPGLLTVIAPRKPERFGVVADKLAAAGVRFVRRSVSLDPVELPAVLLLDSIGELAAVFGRADVVFMGGTLANRGGHNILEPAYFAKPVVIGPHMENFAAIAEEFRDATVRIANPAELGPAIMALLDDPARRAEIGERARAIAVSKRGVAERLLEEIRRARGEGVPNPPRILAARAVLTPLSWIWRVGGRIKATGGQKRLGIPVISVGGLAMGGTGKSPLVAHLARRLREMGRNPAILTRGYRRESTETIIVPRGGTANVHDTGDEAQMFVRAGDAHVGVGADRFAVGQKMLGLLRPDVFLLDDGFQHRRLQRSHDIVVIDALDPLGGGVFPLGRMREPLSALSRADTIVVTRVAPGQGIAGIERLIARYSPHAAVFRCSVVALGWVDSATGEAATPDVGHPAAFCGLGSPAAFWDTLKALGVPLGFRQEFPDHHRYVVAELKRLAAQAPVLLTTEKDAMNLPADAAAAVAPAKLYWLKIGIEIEGEGELLQRIQRARGESTV
jgi:3-deoxy-D-manno-octulosonic-acid transferase